MSLYLNTKKLDLSTDGHPVVVMLNEKTALEQGVKVGDVIEICWRDTCMYVEVDTTSTLVDVGVIGLYREIWERIDIPNDEHVTIKLPGQTESVKSIKKKLKGEVLTYEEMLKIYQDIASGRLTEVETTYFAASTFNPGFTPEEVYYATKSMAESGDILNFGEMAVDKHSIGGIPSKSVTPILVPIIASFGLTIPNTSTRAITSPAGTSDVLEVLFPVDLSNEEMKEVVAKTNGCMMWGGSLNLAPADDILIHVERQISFESYVKLMISIVAKKVATGLTHLILDIPFGPGTKVHRPEDVAKLRDDFIALGKRFGITIDVYERTPKGPDGKGVGPVLEARDLLYILNRRPEAPKQVENEALMMTGRLLELAGVCAKGQGFELAKQKLESGEAKDKFWEIARAQGAKKKSCQMI